ncbi:hypothetical protein DMN91_009726 [Ooceraea biroi]|uniref:Mos1 transposase HTH domain-containing protein n=1 Tax=Ooceraea biroi TaxID=2015173 RepID=A0A3L8DB03_OOCBI|nr:hypothetical protein DMN91_009726 [Ooceraea biroi]
MVKVGPLCVPGVDLEVETLADSHGRSGGDDVGVDAGLLVPMYTCLDKVVRTKLIRAFVSETARNINAVFGEGSTTKATMGNWFKNFRDGDFSLANEPRGRPKTKVDNDHLRAVVESDPSQMSETARNINAVFGEGSTTKATMGNWFKNFRDGDFSLANEPRGRPKTKVDNDHLRAVVESDPSQSTRELASIFNVSILTILVHLAAIGYLGGIDDGRLDTMEDAERANVTTFIDFTTSKTWLYSSRSERSAKARMCCRTLFPVWCTILTKTFSTLLLSMEMKAKKYTERWHHGTLPNDGHLPDAHLDNKAPKRFEQYVNAIINRFSLEC